MKNFKIGPPFNDSHWFRKGQDARWQFGLPPRGNANVGWGDAVKLHDSSADIAFR